MISPIARSKAFTLVELLIVIMVIAILAAISIVTYNGIQQRAEESRIAASLDSYVKFFEIIATTNGAYPNFGSGCLGNSDDYNAETPFPAGACVISNGTVSSSYNSALSDVLKQVSPSLPSMKIAPVRVDFGGGLIYDYRGVWVSTAANYYELQYWLRGNRTCHKGTKTYNSSSNATRCNIFWGAYS